MLLSPSNVCNRKHVFLVLSAPKNRKLRDKVREQLEDEVFLVFLLAKSKNENDNILVEKESKEKGDILKGDFEDSWRALAYKVMMGYIWVNRCGKSEFLL